LVATKGGLIRPGDGSWIKNGRPEYLKQAAKESARRLGVDAIGLYQFHRPDWRVAYIDSLGAIRDLLDEGVIRMAGISNADPEQIALADEVFGGRLVSVQNQFSPRYTSSYGELKACAERDIAFLPWSPLGGIRNAGSMGDRFATFQEVADGHGVSVQQVILAWELALDPHVIPIPGASRPETITDSAAAVELRLSDDEVASLSAILE
jgi:aryl-alcohol dehydrogenase-like predicted oxidoreductase